LQELIAKNLTTLINYWINNGGLPNVHATAKNFFIFKTDAKKEGNTIDELRPISATSFLFKLLEIVIKNRIDHYMDIGVIKKLKDTQHGFRPKLGTEPQILKLFVDAK